MSKTPRRKTPRTDVREARLVRANAIAAATPLLPPDHRVVGSTTVRLSTERTMGSAGCGCEGHIRYGEPDSKDTTRQINPPSLHDLILRALGRGIEPGSEVILTVYVEMTKDAKPAPDHCMNPWPAHFCPEE